MTFLLFLAGVIIFTVALFYIAGIVAWTKDSNSLGITRKFTRREVEKFYDKITVTVDYNYKGFDAIKLNGTYIQVTYTAYLYLRRRYFKELKQIYREQEKETTDRLLKELGDDSCDHYEQSRRPS